MSLKTFMKCCSIFVFVILLTANVSYAGQLRFDFDPDDFVYIPPTSPDLWLADSYVTRKTDFTLNLYNWFNDSLGENDKISENTKLVLAIPNDTLMGSWSAIISDGNTSDDRNLPAQTFYYSSFNQTGNHPELGENSIYSNARWTEYADIGTLDVFDGTIGGDDTASIRVQLNDIPTMFLLHLDAYGYGAGPGKKIIFVPPSHDININTSPEPISFVLMGLGLSSLGLGVAARRRKNK